MPDREMTVLDVQRMRVVPSRANEPPDREIECEVLVVGGGMGGVAAALAAARAGRSVLLTEETDWLGGQMTAQGVSALDEHRFIESFGGTASYAALRQAIRDIYQAEYRLAGPAAGQVKVTGVSALAPTRLSLRVEPVGDYSTYTLELVFDASRIDPFFSAPG